MFNFFFIVFLFLDDAGSGEPDAHCWAEATHAAEGFPRHLEHLQSTSFPSFLPPPLPPRSCSPTFAPHPHPCCHSSVHSYCSASLSSLICLPLSVLSPSHSHYAAESQNGTAVIPWPSSFWSSPHVFGFRASLSMWFHLLELFTSDYGGEILRSGHASKSTRSSFHVSIVRTLSCSYQHVNMQGYNCPDFFFFVLG